MIESFNKKQKAKGFVRHIYESSLIGLLIGLVYSVLMPFLDWSGWSYFDPQIHKAMKFLTLVNLVFITLAFAVVGLIYWVFLCYRYSGQESDLNSGDNEL